MNTLMNPEIFDEKNEDFLSDYYELLINRLTHSNMELEHDLGNINDTENALRLKNNMYAFKKLLKLNKFKDSLSEEVIIETANRVNHDQMYISDGYRLGGLPYLYGTDIPISKPSRIPIDMSLLLYRYFHEWKNLNAFVREAMFHIEFIRIHPFEDGNGRTGRLLMNFNLLQSGIAPVIITTELEKLYHSFIRERDYEGMAHLFEEQSARENEIIERLYKQYQEDIMANLGRF